MSELGMVFDERPAEVLLPGHVPDNLGQPEPRADDGMRRPGNRPGEGRTDEGGNLATTPISRALQAMRERETTCREALAKSASTLESHRTTTVNIQPSTLARTEETTTELQLLI